MQINKLHFLDQQLGWIVGRQDSLVFLYKTSDGGMTWTEEMQNQGTSISVYFLNPNFGRVAIARVIYHTQDGGRNWETHNVSALIADIYFIDAAQGWMEWMDWLRISWWIRWVV